MKWQLSGKVRSDFRLNSNIRCIEISSSKRYAENTSVLNSNIRCIEITLNPSDLLWFESWIVTLDVLKSSYIFTRYILSFRWIVTLDVLKYKSTNIIITCTGLNSNIRCIEIDILKQKNWQLSSWIVTLDVLKFKTLILSGNACQLNSNIRCIEMHLFLKFRPP